jgi:two-component system alkaline phosphatase synthesis response regulator PhoP
MSEKKKILIVDDSHDILDLLELYLYSAYEVVTAVNGYEGLDKARQHQPDCIITDIMMPGMDGIALFNNVRKVETLMAVPIIAVTSFDRNLNTKSLLNLGFNNVVVKPLKRDTILDIMKKALAPPRSSRK